MVSVIITIVALVLGLIGCDILFKYYDGLLLCIITIFLIVSLMITVIILPLSRFITNQDIQSFIAAKKTIINARANKNISSYELASLQIKIISLNADLAADQYAAKLPVISMFYPKAILKLKPLK